MKAIGDDKKKKDEKEINISLYLSLSFFFILQRILKVASQIFRHFEKRKKEA